MTKDLLKLPLHTYQSEAVDFHNTVKYSINGFMMGCGKTPTAIALAAKVNLPTLVVCPAYLILNWQRELLKFSKNPDNFTVISYNKFAKLEISKVVEKVFIFDEIHYLKNIGAKRTLKAHSVISQVKPEYLIGLSATPIKNRVPELWSLIKICSYGNEHVKKLFEEYAFDPWHFNCTFSFKKTFFMGSRKITKFEGLKNRDKLLEILKPMFAAKAAVGLPARVRRKIDVSIGKHSSEEFQATLQKAFEDKLHYMRIKKENAIAKVPSTISLAQDFKNQQVRVVIFTDHVDSCEAIAKAFKVVPLHGGSSMQMRNKEIDRFEAKQTDVLVATIGALSVGANLVSAHHMIFNDYPWVPADMLQAEGRIRRITQKETCFYHYLVSGKVDEKLLNQMFEKSKTTKAILGG